VIPTSLHLPTPPLTSTNTIEIRNGTNGFTRDCAVFCLIELEYANFNELVFHEAELAWFDGI
jgi:hypothetical protein